MSEAATGRCACGAVSYEARGPLRAVWFCHCESCRRQTGHHVAATSVRVEDLAVAGGANLAEWQATPHAVRRFCRICGSHLFWQGVGGDTVSIMAGSLDLPTGIRADRHIYVGEKGDYYDIADGLPQSTQR
ncbi:GFA family protein [Microbaculum marinum]|uniref:GFA family protein n=1 Tax=Microbaculum marinum TaxID=1764581 RepID=A0AAW9RZT5_9HYPH